MLEPCHPPKQETQETDITDASPPRHVRLGLTKQARLFDRKVTLLLAFTPALIKVLPIIIPRQLALQKREDMSIDLLKLE